jgi:hypothetical protein
MRWAQADGEALFAALMLNQMGWGFEAAQACLPAQHCHCLQQWRSEGQGQAQGGTFFRHPTVAHTSKALGR